MLVLVCMVSVQSDGVNPPFTQFALFYLVDFILMSYQVIPSQEEITDIYIYCQTLKMWQGNHHATNSDREDVV